MVSALLTMCGQTIMLLEKVTCNIFSISDRILNTIYFFFIYLLLISFRIFANFQQFFPLVVTSIFLKIGFCLGDSADLLFFL